MRYELRLAACRENGGDARDLGDRIGVEVDARSAGPYRDDLEFDVPIGRCVFVERGGVETAVNVGDQPYREILIELKDAP